MCSRFELSPAAHHAFTNMDADMSCCYMAFFVIIIIIGIMLIGNSWRLISLEPRVLTKADKHVH